MGCPDRFLSARAFRSSIDPMDRVRRKIYASQMVEKGGQWNVAPWDCTPFWPVLAGFGPDGSRAREVVRARAVARRPEVHGVP